MPKRGPKRKLDRPVLWKTTIPSSLWHRIEPLLEHDTLRGTVAYGARGKLTEELLLRWVEEQEAKLAKQIKLPFPP